MTEYSFDLSLWLRWREFINIGLNSLGLISAFLAYSSYKSKNNVDTRVIAFLFSVILIYALGCFPIEWGYGTDRANYANEFLKLTRSSKPMREGDLAFTMLTKFLGTFLNVKQYFIAIAFIYVFNYYIAITKIVGRKSYWLLAAIVISFGFVNYSINTMRAGLALSFIILSFAFYPSKWKMLLCLLIGVNIHNSVAIPALMMTIAYVYPKTRIFYNLWFLSIPVSFVAGNFFMTLFAGLSDDQRTHYLTNTLDTAYNVGFRVDFILYSLAPIVVGGYYIFKKKFTDKFYAMLYNTYILTNIFWILVIRANYSDRFAYLSWFIMPIVLVYPLLKQKLKLKENIWLGAILLGEALFRMIM